MGGLVIPGKFVLDEADLAWQYTTSSGPGGQHVNRTETQARLIFRPGVAASVPEAYRELLLQRLGPRLTGEGALLIESSRFRSRQRNREDALEKLAAILAEALRRRKKRRPTKPTRAAVERRLAGKKQRAAVKRDRRSADSD